jgi:glycosyltransferase involved in cell wall biosynthesis
MKQSDRPLLSIVIPVKKDLIGLQKTLEILFRLNEQSPELELIVIDGGGCEETAKFLLQNQHRIQHIRSSADAGIYQAMNYGKGCATGRWVWFCGAGDLPNEATWEVTLFDMKAWQQDRLHILGVDLGDGREAGVPAHYPPRWDDSLIWRNTTHHQGVIYPLSVIQATDFDPNFSVLADYAVHLHFWASGIQAVLHNATWSFIKTGGVSRRVGLRLYWQEWRLKRRTIRGWRLIPQPLWLLIKFGFKKTGISRSGSA